jgi:hypothetical protein
MTNEEQFRFEELKAAHNRIDQEIAAMNNFEIVSVVAMGAIYFTFFSQRIADDTALVVLFSLPAVVCAYGLFRYRGHASIVQVHEAYIKKLEKKFLRDTGLVGHYDENKTGQLRQARFAFWSIMLLFSLVLAAIAVTSPQTFTKIHSPNADQTSSKTT